MNRLLFRRQFIALHKDITGPEDWTKDVLVYQNKDLFIYHHPDLEYSRGKNDSFELIILGYLLDPYNPEFSDNDILEELLKRDSFEEVIEASDQYTGRYVMIYSDGNGLFLFNDPVGFRELYYCYECELVAFGSTPDILSEYVESSRTEDPDILAFFNSEAFKKTDGTWIGDKTLYDNILHLIPNHYLEVNTREVVRFWPKKPLPSIDLEECARECARILKGTMESSVNRYEVHVGLTAGWDTRLLLAASKEIRDKIFFYVNRPSEFSDGHRDLTVPQRMAEELGFDLSIVGISDEVDEDFRKAFLKNNALARELLLPVFHEVYKRNWQDTYTVTGTYGNGLARIYWSFPEGIEPSGKGVALFAGYQDLSYPVRVLDGWVDSVWELCQEYGINLMGLYDWEQENPHWGSLASSEQDIVREEIRPFNNRRLITLLWSLENKYRYQYHPIIYISIMRILWKDVLKFPLNPSRKSQLYRILRTLGIERKVYNYYKKRKFLKSLNKA